MCYISHDSCKHSVKLHIFHSISVVFQGIGSSKKGKNPSEEKLTEPSPDSIDIEASSSDGEYRRRKTSQNLTHYGSFFLRIGAIGKLK